MRLDGRPQWVKNLRALASLKVCGILATISVSSHASSQRYFHNYLCHPPTVRPLQLCCPDSTSSLG